MYLKEDGYITYVAARKGNSLEEQVDEIEDQWELFKSPTKEWWVELEQWCVSMQARALQDMAFNDSIHFIMAWTQCDQLAFSEPPIMNIYKWLNRREDLDVG